MLPTYSKTVKRHNQLHFVLDPKLIPNHSDAGAVNPSKAWDDHRRDEHPLTTPILAESEVAAGPTARGTQVFQDEVVGVRISGVSGLLGWALPWVGRPMLSGAHGEEDSARMWKALTYFVELPGVGVSMLNVFLKSQHREHPSLPPTLISTSGPSPCPGEMVTIPSATTLSVNPLQTGYEDE
ncbi:Cytochrome c oxidase subunit 6A1, mitochondrial [Microtus ochrogaster]|uniref:Cytochrome c oxidase subunit 6A1, mitochondrial n=1 Tax=Microtus ochrogaster TaxID=79684 RepID=A0A8J6GY47_MICOH|nr:Cytochrome c oxidase subunit 6A1, mitochondrial [Microtus ochrogaster]